MYVRHEEGSRVYYLYSNKEKDVYFGCLEQRDREKGVNERQYWSMKTPLSTSVCGASFIANNLDEAIEFALSIAYRESSEANKTSYRICTAIKEDKDINIFK